MFYLVDEDLFVFVFCWDVEGGGLFCFVLLLFFFWFLSECVKGGGGDFDGVCFYGVFVIWFLVVFFLFWILFLAGFCLGVVVVGGFGWLSVVCLAFLCLVWCLCWC